MMTMMCTRVPVNPKWLSENFNLLQVYVTNICKYCWNMVYPCQMEDFKMKIVDLYTLSAGEKASGEQILELLGDLIHGGVNAGPG